MDHSTLPSVRFEWDHLTVSSGIISTREQATAVIGILQVLSDKLLPMKGELVAIEKQKMHPHI